MKENISCPKCHEGTLIREIDEFDRPYFHCDKCEYQIHNALALEINKRCPKCGDFLVLKRGRKNKFFACHSCDYVEV